MKEYFSKFIGFFILIAIVSMVVGGLVFLAAKLIAVLPVWAIAILAIAAFAALMAAVTE